MDDDGRPRSVAPGRQHPRTRWIADPGVRWRILLTARVGPATTVPDLQAGLDALATAQGWPATTVLTGRDPAALRSTLAEVDDGPVALGLAGSRLVVSCHHGFVDGLGLLDVLGAVTRTAVTSDARGVDGRPDRGSFAASLLRRVVEVVAAPPARVAGGGGGGAGGPGDVMLERSVARAVAPADLVWAAAAGVTTHNRAAGVRTRHLAIAVGAGRRGPGAAAATGGPTDVAITDRSALIRLRDLESLDRSAVRERLRGAPLVPRDGQGPGGGRAALLLLRLLSSRLGSTLLVSHLGELTTHGVTDVTDVAFYPVTAGGSGLAMGAVGLDGRTVITLRGRAGTWAPDELARVLDAVVTRLGELADP